MSTRPATSHGNAQLCPVLTSDSKHSWKLPRLSQAANERFMMCLLLIGSGVEARVLARVDDGQTLGSAGGSAIGNDSQGAKQNTYCGAAMALSQGKHARQASMT